MPAQRGELRLLRLQLREQHEVFERDREVRRSHLAERQLGLEQVLRPERPSEPAVRAALTRHMPLRGGAGRRRRAYIASWAGLTRGHTLMPCAYSRRSR